MTAKKKTKLIKPLLTVIVILFLYAVIYILMDGESLSRHYKGLIITAGINVILAVSLNLTVGFLGNLTLGHAGFMSVGAYAGCLLTIKMNLPFFIEFPLSLLVGGFVAALFGIIIGVPALRLRGDYLAIVTLAFGEIIRSVFNNLTVIGGAGGLSGIKDSNTESFFKSVLKKRTLNSDDYMFYNMVFTFLVITMIVITIVVIANLVKSRQGRAICAIRDNVIAAESIGINVVYHKLLAFVIAAFFAGAAGVLYGNNVGILKPASFDFNRSIEILVIVVLGGMGSIPGSVIAAIIITFLPEMLREFADYRMLIYSIVLIFMMLLNASPAFRNFKQSVQNRIDSVKEKIAAKLGFFSSKGVK